MNEGASSSGHEENIDICISVTQVINAKIQKTDYELNHYLNKLKNPNQVARRPANNDKGIITKQKQVFDIIENSCKNTSKLLFLRANLNSFNSRKVLELISSFRFKTLSLQEIKDELFL